ncbi:MAG: YceI family protein [Bacteroidetes bacterium]|nr:YceI family protein [Bacteroidota bacterium]
MKTYPAIIILIALSLFSSAQTDRYSGSYVCMNGMTHFFASTPIEDIDATSKVTLCVINTETKKVYAKVRMTSFDFRRKLMQEHFNEDYVESEKYPYAILDADIVSEIDFTKDGTYDITLKGTFEVHGVKQDREIKGKLTIKDGQPKSATAEFDVKLVDHKIKIPKAVIAKIAEVFKVNVDFTFEKYTAK